MANNKEDVMKQWRISLWTDSVSESVPHLIVSRDLIDTADGGALVTQTLRVFLVNEHAAAERYARRYAQREHLPLVDETASPAGR
jgi:hypothetical protein